jgi:hypothetical protein
MTEKASQQPVCGMDGAGNAVTWQTCMQESDMAVWYEM